MESLPLDRNLASCDTPVLQCRWELEQRRMTPPSNFIQRITVEEDPRLGRTLNTNYAGAAADGGLEPAERVPCRCPWATLYRPAMASGWRHGCHEEVHGRPPERHNRHEVEGRFVGHGVNRIVID
jgi:hypothetical protein